jgi:hypothetical protein
MNYFSLLRFLSPKFALSSFLILSERLIGFIAKFFSGQPKYRRSRHNLRIGGGFGMLGIVKFSGHVSWTSASQAAYQPSRRIYR